MRWKTAAVATTMLAFALACGGGGGDWDTEGWNDLSAGSGVSNPTMVTGGAPGIENLSGTKIWLKATANPPSKDYCKILGDAGLIVECDYGWSVISEQNNVMLKCGSLPDDTTKWLIGALDLGQLEQWDWRKEPEYGMPYCDEMDAITLEIVTP